MILFHKFHNGMVVRNFAIYTFQIPNKNKSLRPIIKNITILQVQYCTFCQVTI